MLSSSVNNSGLVRMSECTYYIRHVSVLLLIRKGRIFIVRSTQQEKLVLISAWKADKSAFAGCARLTGLWTPAFRKTQSKSECLLVILEQKDISFLMSQRPGGSNWGRPTLRRIHPCSAGWLCRNLRRWLYGSRACGRSHRVCLVCDPLR